MVRLFLTDSKNRPLGRSSRGIANSNKTAAGLINNTDDTPETADPQLDTNAKFQSTRGNLSFTATVRADIVQVYDPSKLQTPPIPEARPGYHNTGTLVWENYGEPRR